MLCVLFIHYHCMNIFLPADYMYNYGHHLYGHYYEVAVMLPILLLERSIGRPGIEE